MRIGITGGIGSGKSMVSRLLQILGVPVYDSDTETKRLMASDPSIRRRLQALLGEEAYANGRLNRPLLASYLFSSPQHAHELNAIIHPCVKAHFREWAARRASFPIVGIESAILIEAGFRDVVDRVVLVTAPEELRIARAVHRDTTSREEIMRRIHSQTSDEAKLPHSDYLILNDNQTPLIPQVISLIKKVTVQ